MATIKNEYRPQIAFHPGETLKEKLQESGMGPREFAVRTNKPEKTIFAVLNGTSSITPEMAVLFENVLKIPARFWLNMQRNYDEFKARQEQETILKASVDWAKKFPVADLIKKGWILPQKSMEEKAAELLRFFGISSNTAWDNYYLRQELKVAFRISLAHSKEPHAISAWLRRGELQAAELETMAYDKKRLQKALPVLKNIMAKQPTDFFAQLQHVCLETGVKVVHTPCIKKAPISGSTRWLNDTPLIQLSGRYKRNDGFWFTFFHEVGHILLHGKKDIFLEDYNYFDKDETKEQEADAFAVKWTLSEEEERIIVHTMQHSNITEEDILQFAEQFNTHPAIIIGRLHHRKILPYSVGNEFIEPISFE